MISRQCLKLASPRRGLPFRQLLHAEVHDILPKFCRCRSLQSYSLLSKKYSLTKTYCNSYATQVKKESQITSKQDELLEKYIAGLSADIFQKNRVYKNDFLRVLNKIKDLNFSTKKQGLLLLRCCSDLLPDEAPSSRMTLVEDVWNILKEHTTFEVEHYNELLKVYIANHRTLNVSKFLQQMAPVQPNVVTYELIIKALGEAGDLNQAYEVLSNMKAQKLPATDSIFNSLIICQGVIGKPENATEVLSMMRSLKLGSSVETHTALARVYAYSKKNDALISELAKAKEDGIQFEERHIMEIVKTLAKVNNDYVVPQVLRHLPESTLKSPSISPYMQSVATQLVFQNHPKVALEIYKCLPLPSFGPKDDPGLHGRGLVRDCVKASLPSGMIVLITQELMSSGRNPIAIHNACEAALQLGKVPLALDLFTRMKQLGLPIRPHYFWPILIHTSKSSGEKGIMNTLQAMGKMDIKPDYDTLMDYTLPYVSFTSPQNLMKKFQEAGLSISSVLTPMMDTLLNMGQVRAASEICEIFKGKVDVDRILKPLLKGYFMSSDLTSTIHILEDCAEKASDKNKDWIGRFLCTFMQNKRAQHDLSDFINILKVLKQKNMKISTSAADYCLARLSDNHKKEVKDAVMDIIVVLTDERLVDEGEMFTQMMPHPRDMDETALRGHLSELEAKGMNTRGVLRKLLQKYCKNKNLQAAREIAEKCIKEGVFLSAGMKAAIFDLHVKLGELELAEASLADLNKTSPNFTLDEHKVIDFATLLVFNKQIDRAMEMIKAQSKLRRIMGGRNLAMNCWRLLDATSAHGSGIQIKQMFDILTKLGYCNPTNALMGPLVKVHMHKGNLDEAVTEFVRLAKTYNKTPLKHELLCTILIAMGDGGNEENFLVNEKANGRMNKLAQIVLNVDKQVHGAGDVQLTLIAALAHVGYYKTLRKLMLDPTVQFHPDALLRRCERFADEGNAKALLNVADCVKDLRRIDVMDIYEFILDVYQRTSSVQDALQLWNKIQESDITPSQKFVKNISSLLESQHRELPPDLRALLGTQEKKAQ